MDTTTAAVTIIVALLSMAGSGLGVFFANKKQTALFMYRVEQLEIKQDKHNEVIERMYEAEKVLAVHAEEIAVANHRIEDLEDK